MALTESTMLALNSQAPHFSLKSTSGELVSLDDFAESSFLVLIFMCNHCPYVIHIADALKSVSDQYMAKGIGFVGINSNDAEAYPADNFESMKLEVSRRGYAFPYLFDEQQDVAKAYGAACTPDLYVLNKDRTLVYRGQFDDSRPHRISSGNYDTSDGQSTGDVLSGVLDILLKGDALSAIQIPSLGCNIKWKPGSEPDYY